MAREPLSCPVPKIDSTGHSLVYLEDWILVKTYQQMHLFKQAKKPRRPSFQYGAIKRTHGKHQQNPCRKETREEVNVKRSPGFIHLCPTTCPPPSKKEPGISGRSSNSNSNRNSSLKNCFGSKMFAICRGSFFWKRTLLPVWAAWVLVRAYTVEDHSAAGVCAHARSPKGVFERVLCVCKSFFDACLYACILADSTPV